MQHKYDYIIAGAGCAGLSLLMRMLASPTLCHKKILLVDVEAKHKNDRTWCFWEDKNGFFEEIVFREWNSFLFNAEDFSKSFSLKPYQYKMIRGVDFYTFCFDKIAQFENVEVRYAAVQTIHNSHEGAYIVIDDKRMHADYVFNSIIFDKPVLKKNQHYLLQHFKGWVINTATPQFNEAEPVFMDFRVSQQQGTTFAYVLPFSPTKALVEYTLFTEKLLDANAYDDGLKNYIQHFAGISDFEIEDEEFGIIPMTNYTFSLGEGSVINIGTAGGHTKASSGYTFQFIQKHTGQMIAALEAGKSPLIRGTSHQKKFMFYDSVLLHILATKTLQGSTIFKTLFQKNDAKQVLRFLDNETSITEDLQLISTLPTMPFLSAAFAQIFAR